MTLSNSILMWSAVTSRRRVVFGLLFTTRQRWQTTPKQSSHGGLVRFVSCFISKKYWCCDHCILLVLLVLLFEALKDSPSWTCHWYLLKEVGKMINSAFFSHCVSVTLMGSSEVPNNNNKKHSIWALKLFSEILLANLLFHHY